jgi:hypothetical protein
MSQAGMIGRGDLGGFIVRHLSNGVEFLLVATKSPAVVIASRYGCAEMP